MGRNIVKAKLDVVFKKMFSDANNEDMLHDFLSGLLDIPYNSIKNIVVQNSEILPESVTGKFSKLDLKMQVDDRAVNVEMQVNKEDAFRDRALFYWSKLYSGDLRSGEEYDRLRKSISVNIINFNEFDTPDYHSVFKVMETSRGEILSDKCAIHFFELKKLGRNINKDNRMELWLHLINAESEEELDMLDQTGVPMIRKAVMVIHEMSDDEKVRELARLREKALHDEVTALRGAERRGIEKGMQKGIQKGIKQGMEKGIQQGMEKGIQQGMEKGIQQGIQQGIEKARVEMIEKMRLSGMSEEEIARVLSME